MIVKEKDAFQYDCPQKLAADAFNRSCAGQACMAWRWALEDNPDFLPPNMNFPSDPRKNLMFIRSKTHGYCGIAGQA